MKTKRTSFLTGAAVTLTLTARRAAMTLLLAVLTAATAWADAVTLSVDNDFAEGTEGHYYVNMPKGGTNTLTLSDASVTTFKVYDDGGKGGDYTSGSAGNYSNNCKCYLILTAPTGYVFQLSGEIKTSYNDYLFVYDGSTTTAPQLFSDYSYRTINPIISTGQSMMLYFESGESYNSAGLDLTVTLINANTQHNITVNTAPGGSVAASVGGNAATTAKLNDVVTLTASPSTGYVLNNLSVMDAKNKAVAVTWNVWTNTATFTMPGSAVIVTPTFTSLTNLSINLPKDGKKTAIIPAGVQSFKVYDDGGASGNYSDGCYGYLTLTAPTGYKLQLSGNITTDGRYDKLTVNDGSTTSAPELLDNVSSTSEGTQTAIPTVVSSGQSLTFFFYSNSSNNYAGLDLTVTLISTSVEFGITVNTVANGSIASDKSSAKPNDVVTLTATPQSGYLLSGISVTDGSNDAVDVAWNGPFFNTATFTMPGSAVTVTPTFTNNLTSPYITMPKTGNQTFTIPTGLTSFKVYDDGGASGNYSSNCSGILTLTAPTGYVLQLSGNIATEKDYDKLTVYDGSTTSGTKLLDKVSSTSDGIQTAITTVTSSGQSMTLYFYSDGSKNYAGLDLTVTLISTNMEYNITVNAASGGTVVASVGGNAATTAKVKDVVTLTASPSTGYLLSGISVTDGSSNIVPVTDIDWYSGTNTVTFAMPGTDVTVTPTFTSAKTAADGLYINMPTTDQKTAIIPAGVQSFKVYDDGGASGNYSNNCSGTLTLTAPTGYVLQLSGNIATEKNYDMLTVREGNTILLDNVSSTSNGTQTAITTVTNSSQSMTLYFFSNSSTNHAGLDLTVTLITKKLELANNADNADAISGKNGQTIAELTLVDRTLLTNGDWNTLCLPFSMTEEQTAASPLASFIIKELDGTSSNLDNNGTLTLNFQDATAITAGKPYIVKWNPATAVTSTPIFNPADDVVNALKFISEVPTYDNGQASNWNSTNEGPAKLVDGNLDTKYGLTGNPWVEFHYASAITPKGYALWTANDAEDGARNPKSWTIKAKNSGDANWTILDTVDNKDGGKLPKAINQRTVFALNNSTAYQYFRFEATPASNGQFQLAELQFCTVLPTITPANITDPVFNNVTIDNSTEAQAKMTATSNDGNVKFVGTYSPFATTDGLLFDAHNTANGAFHAALSATRDGYAIDSWYTDAGKTTAATTIPFTADGTVTLYGKWTEASGSYAYIDEHGTEQSHIATVIDGSQANLPGGWYVVNRDVNMTKLNFTGETHLILADGKTLSIDASSDSGENGRFFGLLCKEGEFGNDPTYHDLTIYGQSKGTGKISSNNGDHGSSWSWDYYANNITINGGVVEAIGHQHGIVSRENLTINGGQVSSNTDMSCNMITLGWLKATDFIYAYNYYNADQNTVTIKIADGKSMTDGTNIYTGTLSADEKTAIAGKTLRPCLVLADNASNADVIASCNGKTITVALNGRTIYSDGDWNTLCLPFALTAEQIAASPLAGFTIKELDGSTSSLDNNGKLTLNFQDATAITAGKPYIVKWNTIDTSTPIFNPADDVVTALNFISDKPTFDGGQESNWNKTNEGPAKLVDCNTSTKYGLTGTPWVEFHYASAITPKGYALWTASDAGDGSRNPQSWTIKAKVNSGDNWTTLVTVDNKYGDKLPKATNTRTVFALNNSTAYKYFRFEATPASNSTNNGQFQLAELQFCTVQPSVPTVTPANITDPVFNNVTIDNSTEAQAKMTATSNDGNVKFVGTYSPFATTDGLLLDAHNTANGAFHAALSATCDGYTIGGWYTDAGKTTAATTIPFAADGSATLYVKWTENATVTRGDANGDGKITVTDIAVVVNYILQLTNTEFYLTGADANGDGYVTVTDIGVIVDMILGNNVNSNANNNGVEPQ